MAMSIFSLCKQLACELAHKSITTESLPLQAFLKKFFSTGSTSSTSIESINSNFRPRYRRSQPSLFIILFPLWTISVVIQAL